MSNKRTYADRADYIKKAVDKRRKKVKVMAVELKGGKCEICGYDKCMAAMVFHHKDPCKKEFGLSMQGLTRSWESTKRELGKCVLLCSNCHREVHVGETQLPSEN